MVLVSVWPVLEGYYPYGTVEDQHFLWTPGRSSLYSRSVPIVLPVSLSPCDGIERVQGIETEYSLSQRLYNLYVIEAHLSS